MPVCWDRTLCHSPLYRLFRPHINFSIGAFLSFVTPNLHTHNLSFWALNVHFLLMLPVYIKWNDPLVRRVPCISVSLTSSFLLLHSPVDSKVDTALPVLGSLNTSLFENSSCQYNNHAIAVAHSSPHNSPSSKELPFFTIASLWLPLATTFLSCSCT